MTSPTVHDERDPKYGYRLCFVTETEQGNLLASYVRVNTFNVDEPQFRAETDGMQHSEVRLVRSSDNGETWPEASIMARAEDRECIFGDPKITTLPDGRLIALFWRYSLASG